MKSAAVKHYEQGRNLHSQGKLPLAERAYKKSIKIDRDFVDSHNMLGNLYLQSGRFREAFNAYRKALSLAPNHPALLCNIGNALQQQGESEKAIRWLDKAINRDPDSAAAHNNRGNALWSLGKSEAAIAAYKRALELDPRLADSYRNMGNVLVELEDMVEAVECFNEALKINPTDKIACRGLGRAQNWLGNLGRAISAYQDALAIDPDNPELYRELGMVYSDYGEIDKAILSHRKALEIKPDYAEAYRSLVKNKKFTEYDDDIKAMDSLVSRKGIPQEDAIQLSFALGKAYEDIGEYKDSMEFVIKATQLKRNSYDYSIADSQQLFNRIREVFTPDFFGERPDFGDPDRTPIFILGMPRSGSSLVEQILASHAEVYGAGELIHLEKVFARIDKSINVKQPETFAQGILELGGRTFADLGKQYLAKIREFSPDARFITDKMPHNFLYIGFIRVILPNARVIHCTRDPMDNCLSIFKTYLLKGHPYSYELSELGQYYRMYLELMDYWKITLPGFIYDQSYEDLVSSQQEQVSKLLQHCDLQWDDACVDFHKTQRKIQTASNAQVRRPVYNDSVMLWKRYEKQLEPLKKAIYG